VESPGLARATLRVTALDRNRSGAALTRQVLETWPMWRRRIGIWWPRAATWTSGAAASRLPNSSATTHRFASKRGRSRPRI
jgi:hypothetical protein